jgi:hypothetical protein
MLVKLGFAADPPVPPLLVVATVPSTLTVISATVSLLYGGIYLMPLSTCGL